MNCKRHLLYLLFLLPSLLLGQGSTQVSNTGSPSIGVPLWTMSEGDIHLPLSLSYSADGVKVEEQEGWLGTDWHLSGMPYISRTVKGLPDDVIEMTPNKEASCAISFKIGYYAVRAFEDRLSFSPEELNDIDISPFVASEETYIKLGKMYGMFQSAKREDDDYYNQDCVGPLRTSGQSFRCQSNAIDDGEEGVNNCPYPFTMVDGKLAGLSGYEGHVADNQSGQSLGEQLYLGFNEKDTYTDALDHLRTSGFDFFYTIVDTEQDIFHLNLPGKGKIDFVIQPVKNGIDTYEQSIIPLTHTDVLIQLASESSITQDWNPIDGSKKFDRFLVTDESGTMYSFKASDYTTTNTLKHTKSWQQRNGLSQHPNQNITSPFFDDFLSFSELGEKPCAPLELMFGTGVDIDRGTHCNGGLDDQYNYDPCCYPNHPCCLDPNSQACIDAYTGGGSSNDNCGIEDYDNGYIYGRAEAKKHCAERTGYNPSFLGSVCFQKGYLKGYDEIMDDCNCQCEDSNAPNFCNDPSNCNQCHSNLYSGSGNNKQCCDGRLQDDNPCKECYNGKEECCGTYEQSGDVCEPCDNAYNKDQCDCEAKGADYTWENGQCIRGLCEGTYVNDICCLDVKDIDGENVCCDDYKREAGFYFCKECDDEYNPDKCDCAMRDGEWLEDEERCCLNTVRDPSGLRKCCDNGEVKDANGCDLCQDIEAYATCNCEEGTNNKWIEGACCADFKPNTSGENVCCEDYEQSGDICNPCDNDYDPGVCCENNEATLIDGVCCSKTAQDANGNTVCCEDYEQTGNVCEPCDKDYDQFKCNCKSYEGSGQICEPCDKDYNQPKCDCLTKTNTSWIKGVCCKQSELQNVNECDKCYVGQNICGDHEGNCDRDEGEWIDDGINIPYCCKDYKYDDNSELVCCDDYAQQTVGNVCQLCDDDYDADHCDCNDKEWVWIDDETNPAYCCDPNDPCGDCYTGSGICCNQSSDNYAGDCACLGDCCNNSDFFSTGSVFNLTGTNTAAITSANMATVSAVGISTLHPPVNPSTWSTQMLTLGGYEPQEALSINEKSTYYHGWTVEKITSATGREMTFEYDNIDHYSVDHNIHSNLRGDGSLDPNDNDVIAIITETYRRHPSKISGTHTDMRFVTSEKTGYSSEEQKNQLDRIELISKMNFKEEVIRTFTFEYDVKESQSCKDYITAHPDNFSVDTPEDQYCSRSFLAKLSTLGKENEQLLPPYQFTYESLPDEHHRFSTEQDFWGFFNDNGQESMIPHVHVSFSRDAYFYDVFYDANTELSYTPNYDSYIVGEEVDRNTNPNTITAGVLDKIYLPSGGYVDYDFEAHDFFFQHISDSRQVTGGGIRIAQIKKHDGIDAVNDIVTRYEYTLPNNSLTSSGQLIHVPQFAKPKQWYFSEENVNFFTSPSSPIPSIVHGPYDAAKWAAQAAQGFQLNTTATINHEVIYGDDDMSTWTSNDWHLYTELSARPIAPLYDSQGRNIQYTHIKVSSEKAGSRSYHYHAPQSYQNSKVQGEELIMDIWDPTTSTVANASKFKLIKDEWTGACFHMEELVDEVVTYDGGGYSINSVTNFDDGDLLVNGGYAYGQKWNTTNFKDYFESEGILRAQNIYGNYPLAYDGVHTYGLLHKTEDRDERNLPVKSTEYIYDSGYHTDKHPVMTNTRYPHLLDRANKPLYNYRLAMLDRFSPNAYLNKIKEFRFYRYQLPVMDGARLIKTKETLYDQSNVKKQASTEVDYFYASHTRPFATAMTNSDGTTQISLTRYLSDMSTSGSYSNWDQAYYQNNQLPIEQLSLRYSGTWNYKDKQIELEEIARGSVSTLNSGYRLLGASLFEYERVNDITTHIYSENVGNTRAIYLPKHIYQLGLKVPATQLPMTLGTDAKSGLFGLYNASLDSRYYKVATLNSYNSQGRLLNYTGLDGLSTQFFYGHQDDLVIGELQYRQKALYPNFFYTNWEEVNPNQTLATTQRLEEWDLENASLETDDPYNGQVAVRLDNGTAERYLWISTSSKNKYYYLSLMVKKLDENVASDIKITTDAHFITGVDMYTYLPITIQKEEVVASTTIDSEVGQWEYYTFKINVVELDKKYNGTANYMGYEDLVLHITGSVAIDEIRLRPYHSHMTTYTYEPMAGYKEVMDNNGRKTSVAYDGMLRNRLIRNDFGDIISRYTYQFKLGEQNHSKVSGGVKK